MYKLYTYLLWCLTIIWYIWWFFWHCVVLSSICFLRPKSLIHHGKPGLRHPVLSIMATRVHYLDAFSIIHHGHHGFCPPMTSLLVWRSRLWVFPGGCVAPKGDGGCGTRGSPLAVLGATHCMDIIHVCVNGCGARSGDVTCQLRHGMRCRAGALHI